MTKLGDISGVWNTIRELDVGAIRDEAEFPVTFALIGESDLREAISRLIEGTPVRFPAAGLGAIAEYPLPPPQRDSAELGRATLVILVFDARRTSIESLEQTLSLVVGLDIPLIAICLGADQLPRGPKGAKLQLPAGSVVFHPDASADNLAARVIPALLDRIPTEQQVAVARSFPGLREAVARKVVADTSFSNAAYALTAGVPELVPVLNLPLNAADLLVLTKNQALMVYKLGLAYGAQGDFQAQMREILPVIGSGFVWRQVARQLIGLVPGFGLLPKVAVAYAGTYAAGQVAALWYARGEAPSRDAVRRLYNQAWAIGRKRAAEMLARRPERPRPPRIRRLLPDWLSIRRWLPGRKSAPPPPAEDSATNA